MVVDFKSTNLIPQKLTITFEMTLMVTKLINHNRLIAIAAISAKLDALVIDEMIFDGVFRKLLTASNRAWLFDVLAILQNMLDIIVVFVSKLLSLIHFFVRF